MSTESEPQVDPPQVDPQPPVPTPAPQPPVHFTELVIENMIQNCAQQASLTMHLALNNQVKIADAVTGAICERLGKCESMDDIAAAIRSLRVIAANDNPGKEDVDGPE